MSDIQLQTIQGEARADSRDLAERMDNQHRNVLSLIADYQADFEALGILRFETEKISGRGRPGQYALLNEDQCYLLLTLVRNSEQTVAMKRALVTAFRAARERLNTQQPPITHAQLALTMATALVQAESRLNAIEHRLSTQPIRSNSALRARMHAACQAYGRVHPRGYAGAYREFKAAFGFQGAPLAAYDDLPADRADEALAWLDLQTRTYGAQRPLMDEGGVSA